LTERDFTENTGSATLEDNDSFEDGSGSGEGEVGGGHPLASSTHPFDLHEKSSVHAQNRQGSSLDVKRYRTFDCILIGYMWE
jgi:hypothetical protein